MSSLEKFERLIKVRDYYKRINNIDMFEKTQISINKLILEQLS